MTSGRIIKLLMLTGQRRLEIGHLEWAEIFAERRQIELPAARTKNKRPHIVPLSMAALALLGGLPHDGRHAFGRGLLALRAGGIAGKCWTAALRHGAAWRCRLGRYTICADHSQPMSTSLALRSRT